MMITLEKRFLTMYFLRVVRNSVCLRLYCTSFKLRVTDSSGAFYQIDIVCWLPVLHCPVLKLSQLEAATHEV